MASFPAKKRPTQVKWKTMHELGGWLVPLAKVAHCRKARISLDFKIVGNN